MTIEMFLAIASFAISVGGLIPVFLLEERRKEVTLAVVFTLLIVTTGVVLYRHYQHKQLISQVENEILDELSHNTWTSDQLYQELHYVPFNVVNEALFRAVERGVIGHRVIEFRSPDSSILQVRGYYVRAPL